MGDGVTCAVAGQKVSDGHYRLDRMIISAGRHGAEQAHPTTFGPVENR